MESLPLCAQPCLGKAFQVSSCAMTDVACFCTNTQLYQTMRACAIQSCTVKETLTTRRLFDLACGVEPRANTDGFLVLAILFLIVTAICVLLRLASRLMSTGLGWDDGCIVLAWGIAITVSGIGFPIHNLGLGQDIWNLPFDNITKILYLFNVAITIYPPCMALTKLSMLSLYLRLFPGEKTRLATKLLIAFTVTWGTAFTLATIWPCLPRSYTWLKWDGEHQGHCMDQATMLMVHAITNIILDAVIMGVPLPTLLKLNLTPFKKAGVCLMFVTGFAATIFSILRISTTVDFLKSRNPTSEHLHPPVQDPALTASFPTAGDYIASSIWSGLEINLAIICACLPGIRAFFQLVYPRLRKHIPYLTGSTNPSRARASASIMDSDKSVELTVDSCGRVRPSQRHFVPLEDV
ncbi:hypothetical protein BDW62DRAFT_205035 [Aspergillus aurantiobrunneus]